MKTCIECNIEKNETEYYKAKRCIGGLRPICKQCYQKKQKILINSRISNIDLNKR